ncbi:MAG: hypothetical protein ACFFEF_16100 [Candidatus Thorarchaeota archaeon]
MLTKNSPADWMIDANDAFIDIHHELRPYAEVVSFFRRVEEEFNVTEYCNGANSGGRWVYQIYSKEFITDISAILNRITKLSSSPGPILEVMSGDGKLAEFLHSGIDIDIIATDSKESRDNIAFPKWVVKVDAISAIERYSPSVVLMSWEPFYSDTSSIIVERGIPLLWIGDPSRSAVGSSLETKPHSIIHSDYLLGRNDSFAKKEYRTVIRLFNLAKWKEQ